MSFGGGRKARVMWNCTVLADFWVIWLESNRRILLNYSGDVEENAWERIRFWASLWASLSPAFRDLSLSVIFLDWGAAGR